MLLQNKMQINSDTKSTKTWYDMTESSFTITGCIPGHFYAHFYYNPLNDT